MRNRILLSAAVAALGLSSAGPASAGSASCLWEALPQATRDKIITGFHRGGPAGVDMAAIATPEVLMPGALLCGVSSKDATNAGNALGGYAMETAAAYTLKEKHGYAGDRLDRAWSSLTPIQRRDFSDSTRGVLEGREPTQAGVDVLWALVDAVVGAEKGSTEGFEKTELFTALGFHFYGRASREEYETLF